MATAAGPVSPTGAWLPAGTTVPALVPLDVPIGWFVPMRRAVSAHKLWLGVVPAPLPPIPVVAPAPPVVPPTEPAAPSPPGRSGKSTISIGNVSEAGRSVVHVLLQASPMTPLPSSHASPGEMIPSPQRFLVQSVWQAAVGVFALFTPSSHSSPGSAEPFPQNCKTKRQFWLHGSNDGRPGSHCSRRSTCTRPSPQEPTSE